MRSVIASDVSRTVTARGGAPTSTNANGVIYLKETNPPWVIDFIYPKGKLFIVYLATKETKLLWELSSSLMIITTDKSTSTSFLPSTRTCPKDHNFL